MKGNGMFVKVTPVLPDRPLQLVVSWQTDEGSMPSNWNRAQVRPTGFFARRRSFSR